MASAWNDERHQPAKGGGVMGMDDANDNPGVPGECPGHEWQVDVIDVSGPGAELSLSCVYCGAVRFQPSARRDPNRPPL